MQKFRNKATIDTGFVYSGRRVYVDKTMNQWEEHFIDFNGFPIILCSERYLHAYIRRTDKGLSKYIDGIVEREKRLLEQKLNELFQLHQLSS